MEKTAYEIMTYLNSKQNEMESVLTDLVKVESPSTDPGKQEAIFEVLAREYSKLNFDSMRYPGKLTGGFMLTRPSTRKKHAPIQLMIGHCDTVWETGTLRKMPLIKDQKVMKGPGVFDMKAGLTQMIFAIKAIQDLNISMSALPVCVINADEEIGSRESTIAIKRLSKIASRAFVLEPPLGLDGKLKTARKGLGRFTVTVKGIAAHAGLDPGKGASAILELSHQVQHLFALNDIPRGITVNVGMIQGGVSANVVAPLCSAVVDVRVPTMKDAQEIEHKIFALKAVNPEVTVEVEGYFGRPPMEKTQRNQQLWLKAAELAKRLDLNIEQASAGGGSDANTTSLFTATLDGLGTTGDGAHAIHEFIDRDALIERTALLTLLLASDPD